MLSFARRLGGIVLTVVLVAPYSVVRDFDYYRWLPSHAAGGAAAPPHTRERGRVGLRDPAPLPTAELRPAFHAQGRPGCRASARPARGRRRRGRPPAAEDAAVSRRPRRGQRAHRRLPLLVPDGQRVRALEMAPAGDSVPCGAGRARIPVAGGDAVGTTAPTPTRRCRCGDRRLHGRSLHEAPGRTRGVRPGRRAGARLGCTPAPAAVDLPRRARRDAVPARRLRQALCDAASDPRRPGLVRPRGRAARLRRGISSSFPSCR